MGACTAVGIAATVWVGLGVGRHLGAPWSWSAAIVAIGLAWLGRRAPSRIGTLLLLLGVFAAALARGHGAREVHDAAASRLVPVPAPVWLVARVGDHPSWEAQEKTATLEIMRASRVLPRGARVRLRLPATADLEWGDTLRVLARIEAPPPARVPGVSSAREAAWAQGVVARGRGLWVEGSAARTLPRATVTRWRRTLETCFARELTPATREIVIPLVTGDRSGLDPDLGAIFRSSGLVHLLALSGLHVVWMASLARGIAAALGGGIASRAWAGAGCALFYVGIAGPLPSLARAAATEVLAATASLRGRALDPLQALAFSTILLLAVAPPWADDLGFQLSCAATLGLATLGRRASEELGRGPRPLSRALSAFVPTAAAQVTSLPIALQRFHALPWTVLGSNLLAVPICDLLLASAWLGVGLETLAPGAGRWCFAACEPLAGMLVAIARVTAAAPQALWATGHSAWPVVLAAAGAVLGVLAVLGPRDLARARLEPSPVRSTLRWLAPLTLGLALVLGASEPPLSPPPGRWWLVTLDVGQGDALAIGRPTGWQLVDAGPRSPTHDAGASAVVPFLQWAAVRELEAVILTHDHGDHTGGAMAVRRAMPVRLWWVVAGTRAPRAAPGHAHRAQAGDTLGRQPTMVARWPVAGFGSRDLNAGSLALEVGEGAGRALLAADIDSTIEARLGVVGRLAVLKVAHHGASASSGAAFLARTQPVVAVISCGARNPFGHPDARVLARLAARGARVRRTDRAGTVWLELGPEGVREVDWRRGIVPAKTTALRPSHGSGGTLAHAPAHW